jgi:hypothetical protein
MRRVSNVQAPKAAAASGRVSQNAPASSSESTNVWRLLEASPGFSEGMERARADFENGRVEPIHQALKHRHTR